MSCRAECLANIKFDQRVRNCNWFSLENSPNKEEINKIHTVIIAVSIKAFLNILLNNFSAKSDSSNDSFFPPKEKSFW